MILLIQTTKKSNLFLSHLSLLTNGTYINGMANEENCAE